MENFDEIYFILLEQYLSCFILKKATTILPFSQKEAIEILQSAVDMIETIIIGKSTIFEDPFFEFERYRNIKKSKNFDEILKYVEGRYEILNILKCS